MGPDRQPPNPDAPPESRNDAVTRYTPMVRALAGRMASRMAGAVEADDLMSAGLIGLIDAFDRFDRTRNVDFRKYAVVRVKGAMLDEVRQHDTLSRTYRRKATEVGRVAHVLEQSLGRPPTDDEIAAAAGLDPDGFRAIRQHLQPVFTVSAEALSETGRDLSNWLYEGAPVDPHASLEAKRLRQFLESQLSQIKDRLALVLRFYFFDGMTLRQIGRTLGVTESRASQLLTEALEVFERRVRAALRRDNDAL